MAFWALFRPDTALPAKVRPFARKEAKNKDKEDFFDLDKVNMSTYRANALEFAGINRTQSIANVQKHQVGYAVDYDKLDEFGKPSVVFAWNRNIHGTDLATKKNYVAPEQVSSISSKEALRISAAKHLTQAYKDGLEYVQAEKDYRAKQEYLDRITPGRSGGPGKNRVSIGTNTSTSGLPVPDGNGVVAHYAPEVTAMTGLMFSAPVGGKEAMPQPTGVGSSGGLVIATKETEEPPMPGLFPNFPSPTSSTTSEEPDVAEVPKQRINPDDLVIASTVRNPQDVEDILESNIIDNRFVPTPAMTPFRFRGRQSESLAGQKRKGTPLPRMDKKRQRTDVPLDGMQPLDEIGFVTSVTIPGGTGTRVPHNAAVLTTVIPEPLKPGVKRPAFRQPEERQIKKRTRLNDADEDIIRLEPVEVVEQAQKRRKATRNVNYASAPGVEHPFDEEPWERTTGAPRNLRPIAALRGKKDIDYAMERPDPLISEVVIPTVQLRRRKAGPSSTEPARKKQRII
ncbi:hypothetical protein BC832DRAFT_541739 [Gaertneriomyces semiglobifer]|nr:hypothetical protein BC832DRAFT_541739 [Gaertneriomyces semiglobifer]